MKVNKTAYNLWYHDIVLNKEKVKMHKISGRKEVNITQQINLYN